jgi:hypothetical protein
MGGGGSSGGSQSTTSETILPDWVASQVQQNIGTANTLASQPYQAYPGQTVAGFSPAQEQAFQEVENLQGSTTPGYTQATNEVANLPQSTQSLLNPYMSQVGGDVVSNIQRAAAQTGQANAANASNVGAFGGSRTGVQSDVLASETQRNIGQAIDQIQQQGWNTASGLALNQASTLGQLTAAQQQANLMGIGALSEVGGQQQAQTQAEYSAALQQWQAQQNYPYQQLAIQQSALSGSPYGNTVQSSQPYSTNPVATALGMTAAGLPIANQLGNWAGLWGPGTGSTGLSTSGDVANAPSFDLYGYGTPAASTASEVGGFSDPVASTASASDAAAGAANKGGAVAG